MCNLQVIILQIANSGANNVQNNAPPSKHPELDKQKKLDIWIEGWIYVGF